MSVSEMPQRERPLSEQFRIVAKQYAEAVGKHNLKENTRTGQLARLTKLIMERSNEKISRAEAEFQARASDEWFQFNMELAELKERVEVLRAQKRYIEFVQWERTDVNANARAERKMG